MVCQDAFTQKAKSIPSLMLLTLAEPALFIMESGEQCNIRANLLEWRRNLICIWVLWQPWYSSILLTNLQCPVSKRIYYPITLIQFKPNFEPDVKCDHTLITWLQIHPCHLFPSCVKFGWARNSIAVTATLLKSQNTRPCSSQWKWITKSKTTNKKLGK